MKIFYFPLFTDTKNPLVKSNNSETCCYLINSCFTVYLKENMLIPYVTLKNKFELKILSFVLILKSKIEIQLGIF